jgi:glycosyltransferase involved in cell wall biosynthesis
VLPTGIYLQDFTSGSAEAGRSAAGIAPASYVMGHVGRLAEEKNLDFLCRAVVLFLQTRGEAHFLVVGDGPMKEWMRGFFFERGLGERAHFMGKLEGHQLADAYRAMDVFVCASQSETQGVVFTEAMAAGVPVVGVDACGVRDVIKDKLNGCLLRWEEADLFARALAWMADAGPEKTQSMRRAAEATAACYAMDLCAQRALGIYGKIREQKSARNRVVQDTVWNSARALIKAEWDILKNLTKATGAVMKNQEAEEEQTALVD